jgi:CHAT domain-containing protein/tetratricopeptide (TPR) repeat protein
MRAHARTATTIVLAVATALGAMLGIAPVRRAYREAMLRRELSRLTTIAAMHSPTQARLGNSAPPLAIAKRSASASAKPFRFYAAVVAVWERAQVVEGNRAAQATAVAHYYAGKLDAAADCFEQLAHAAPSAMAWNDLAAARLERSRSEASASDVVRALVAIEQSLVADPTFAPALFNRAAILERMGLRRLAHAAWRAALVAERDKEWREEIRCRLDATATEDDSEAMFRAFANLRVDEPGDIREAVERFPQEARRQAEAVLPAQWAAAVVAGDFASADETLHRARALASALRNRSGESLAAEAIATIDAAGRSGSPQRVAELASAYTTYGQGRVLLARNDYAAAVTQLEEARRLFLRANNPMASVARYNIATAILGQNRLEEGMALHAALLREERARRVHRALVAQLTWHIARAEGLRGHWDAALAAAQASVDHFRALGEKENIGFMENMLAELHDYLGQPERAWAHRFTAFELLGDASSASRLQVSLGAAARVPMRRKDWPAAIALLDLEIAQSRGTPAQLGDALARRSRAKAAVGDAAGAHQDVKAARAAVLRVTNAEESALIDATIDVAAGIAARKRDPAQSVRLFGSAIAFFQRASYSILLPELYLERGRSHLALGAEADALTDFSSGIDRLEEQRRSLTDFELRSTIGDVAEDLYIEAVRVAVRRRDAAGAYRFTERSRGRMLLDRIAAGDVAEPVSMRKGTRLIEFMILPEKLIAFVIDSDLQMMELDIRSAELRRLVDLFVAAILADSPVADVQAAGAALYEALLRPLEPVTTGVSTLVFVPGGVLERVPWAALYDARAKRYVIEEASVVTAPSATVHTVLSAQDSPTRSALIVGNPKIAGTFVDLPRLSGAEQEARVIATLYRDPLVLLGENATVEAVRRLAEGRDVLHFSAHAVSSELSDDQSFLVLAPSTAGESGVLHSRDIVNMNLRGVSLVSLAACGSLRGPVVHVDGMPSIARSFLAAGVKSVIATLWDVDDARAAAPFARIHAEVARGVPAARALREAQLGALRSSDPALAHPRFWGGLVVVGGR